MKKELIKPGSTAVIVIDLQKGYASIHGKMARLGFGVGHFAPIIKKIGNFLEEARRKGVIIIFTRMVEDPKLMSNNAKEKFKETKSAAITPIKSKDFNYEGLKPMSEDQEIVKYSYDAFTSKKLIAILKSNRIKSVIIIGFYSDACVNATVISAFSRGYHVVVPLDLTSTVKERKHRHDAVIEGWKQFYAHTPSAKQIIKMWGRK